VHQVLLGSRFHKVAIPFLINKRKEIDMKKTCTKCKEEKSSSEFRKDKAKSDGFQPFCKVCAREHHRSNYSEKYSEKYNIRNNERRSKHLSLLNEYKKTLSCVVCGENETVCLEFHHTDPTEKEFTIGASMQRSWESIKWEIDKCVCLCANCHKKVHAGILDL
jgi:hypothetical protein